MTVQVLIADWLRASFMQAWQMCSASIARDAGERVSQNSDELQFRGHRPQTPCPTFATPFTMPSILVINPNSTESMTKSLEGLVKSIGFRDVRSVFNQ